MSTHAQAVAEKGSCILLLVTSPSGAVALLDFYAFSLNRHGREPLSQIVPPTCSHSSENEEKTGANRKYIYALLARSESAGRRLPGE